MAGEGGLLELPAELAPPRPLVKLLGLTDRKDHGIIRSVLTQGRGPACPLGYEEVAGPADVFPARKPKAEREIGVTEDYYTPPGILKANWVTKVA